MPELSICMVSLNCWTVLKACLDSLSASQPQVGYEVIVVDNASTDGTPQRSVFREPQSWGLLEMFKIKDDRIVSVVATFVQSPYKMDSPWNKR